MTQDLFDAVERVRGYVSAHDMKPMRGMGDEIHGLHVGTEFEGSLRLSDLRLILAALQQSNVEQGVKS